MFKNRRTVRIEWGHCDAAHIVFYPRYFEFFDQGTFHLFEAAGVDLHGVIAGRSGIAGHIGAPLGGATAKFLAPCRHGDDVQIESEIVEIGRASFKVAHRVYNGGVLAVDGLETRVWAMHDPDNPGRIKSCPIPDDVRAKLS